jgi:hypothetical protein
MAKKKVPRVLWSRDQLLVAFAIYIRTPFGKLHKGNPEIKDAARAIGRTANALALKTVNFASLDPTHRARGVKGMSNASDADRDLWAEFERNSEVVAAEVGAAWDRLVAPISDVTVEVADQPCAAGIGEAGGRSGQLRTDPDLPTGPTEIERTIRARRVQRFFRDAVLASYDFSCAITGLAVRELLTASHIIPWSESVERRADPRNGIAFNALHDRAFDRRLMWIDDRLAIRFSDRLRQAQSSDDSTLAWLTSFEGQPLRLPHRFFPDPLLLRRHAERSAS